MPERNSNRFTRQLSCDSALEASRALSRPLCFVCLVKLLEGLEPPDLVVQAQRLRSLPFGHPRVAVVVVSVVYALILSLGGCPRISLVGSLHPSLAYRLCAGGDAALVASPWLCNAIAAPEGHALRRVIACPERGLTRLRAHAAHTRSAKS